MPSYLSPGVYVEEVSSGVKPIAGVGTSVGGFVGIAEKGVANKAVLITNWSQFVKEFGQFIANGYLAYGVYGFMAEGGTSCYVVRTLPSDAASSTISIPVTGGNPLVITATSEGAWGNKITANIENPSGNDQTKFKLRLEYDGKTTETYDNLSLPDLAAKVNGVSSLITVSGNLTATRPTNGAYSLTGGSDGDLGSLDYRTYLGDETSKTGLHALDEIDNVNIIAVPDAFGDRSFAIEALNYCKDRQDCFFLADPPQGLTPSAVLTYKQGEAGEQSLNSPSGYGALYYPWVKINDPLTGGTKIVPPSGIAAGTYAYTDSTRGVHKAPAGTVDGYLDSVTGVELIVTKGEQDQLNPEGINVIRSLPDGICIWGARTLSDDTEWVYVNVRRLLMYIEESIDQGTQWVVFEPNTPALWGSVKRNITSFLTRIWRDGALYGSTSEEAFFVKVDEENNPSEVRDAGQLIIEVGVAPVKPAEFVIIRVSQKTL
jgi:phage tail sheath protein FI